MARPGQSAHLELLDEVARLLSDESVDVDFLGCFGHGGGLLGYATMSPAKLTEVQRCQYTDVVECCDSTEEYFAA